MTDTEFTRFEPTLLKFLEELTEKNNRDWFQANKKRYESEVVEPVFAFIRAMRPRLHRVSPYLQAIDKKVGGSMFRIYRDIRFSKDKTPYKDHVGIAFPHSMGRDRSAPGCYVSLAPREVYFGVGIWHPPTAPLNQIRARVDRRPEQWLRARDDAGFRKLFKMEGDSLKRPPRGYAAGHPLIEDLKRKDFVAARRLKPTAILRDGFADQAAEAFVAARPLLAFLAEALGVDF